MNATMPRQKDTDDDVIDEEEADGHRGLGPLRYRSRTRNYSIKGETGDVTDGRIVL